MYCSEKEFNCHVQTDMNTFYPCENIVALVHFSSVQVRMSEAVLVLHVAWLRFISKSKQLMMQNIWHQVKGRQMLPLFPCLSGFGHREWIRLPKTPSPPTRLKINTIYWIGAKIPKCMQLDQVGIKSVIVLVNKGRWQRGSITLTAVY